MPASVILGYAAKAPGRRLEPFEYEPPALGEHDVRVAVTHCGVCHSDIHAIDDYYGITEYPFVPGHEIVGHVVDLGPAVTGLNPGERVGVGWQGRSCGHCEWCLQAEEQLCLDIVESGTWVPYGGFSSSVAVDADFVYPLPAAMPSETAAVLLCAGVAVYAPLRRFASRLDEDSRRLAVVGVGGLGHLAIQFANALSYEVTAISSRPEEEEQALGLGAGHFIDAGDAMSLRQATMSYDLLLCTAGGGVDWDRMLALLRKRGTFVLVGFPDVVFNSTNLVARELTVTGSFLGDRDTMRETLGFAQEHAIRPMVELMSLSQVNEAIRRVRENEARYRIVLATDAGDAR
jgi:alcohol/geraniol dehydrogenase (NADP+)